MSATGACARAGGERRRAEPRYAAGSDSEGLPGRREVVVSAYRAMRAEASVRGADARSAVYRSQCHRALDAHAILWPDSALPGSRAAARKGQEAYLRCHRSSTRGQLIHRSHLQLSLERFLATRTYYPCCVLAHPDIRQLQEAANFVRDIYHWPVLSLGAVLSSALLSVAPRQRTQTANTALLAAIRPFAPGPLLCADIDVLFEPSLRGCI